MPSSEYQVKTGDTLAAIARRFGIGMDVLARHNGISDVNRIYVGQVLKIPEAIIPTKQASSQPRTHRVQAGDTLPDICQRFNVTAGALAEANALKDSTPVVLGQLLVIPAVAPPKPVASGTPTSTPKTATSTAQTPTSSPKPTAQKQTPVKSTLKDEDNLDLGPNETYRAAILKASQRTGLAPQVLAAIIQAEAAKDKKECWKADSKAKTSSAAGLAQFLSGTWVGEACREGTSLHDYARGHDLIEEKVDKKGRRIGWEVKDSDAKATLLDLRLKGEMSIMAAAELAAANLATARKSFKVPETVTRSDLARLAYLYHHEGPTGADRILRQKDTHTKEDVERQAGKKTAGTYLTAHGNNATLAYRAWLESYIDAKIDPQHFARDKEQFPASRPLKKILADVAPMSGTKTGNTPAPSKGAQETPNKAPVAKVSPSTPQVPKQSPSASGSGAGKAGKAPDLTEIARNVYSAMKSEGVLGMGVGTSEQKVYDNLARLNHDASLIQQFKTVYQRLYHSDAVADIRSEFSNNWFDGDELDRALSFLRPSEQPKTPAAKTAQNVSSVPPPSSGTPERSGKHWVSRFLPSKALADLKEPFQSHVRKFFEALEEAGIETKVNTTLRPPQRSYLMYYTREVASGRLQPDKVPAFVPQNGDAPVNIDWAHRDSHGKADLESARKAAEEMDHEYGAAGAIGKPYHSNHNGGEAIDVRFVPAWGIGKSVVDADGSTVAITSKKDLITVGATYKVYHWNYKGSKPKKDDPHWSKTGN